MARPIWVWQHPRSVSRMWNQKRLSRLLGEEASAIRWSGEVSVVLLSSVSTEPHRHSEVNISTKWLSPEWHCWRPAGQTNLRNVTELTGSLSDVTDSSQGLLDTSAPLAWTLYSYLKGFGNAICELSTCFTFYRSFPHAFRNPLCFYDELTAPQLSLIRYC